MMPGMGGMGGGGGGGGMGGMEQMMGGMGGGGGGGMPGGMGGMPGMGDSADGGGGMPGMGDGNGDDILPEVSLNTMLSQLDMLEKMESKIPKSMRGMITKVKHVVLDHVSCVTACLHKNVNGKCHEQSCIFHYKPGNTAKRTPILCAESITIMAHSQQAAGQVHFAIKTFPIEPEDDLIPTEFYHLMDTKYKYNRRLKDGTLQEQTVPVCHAFHNTSCPEHPPPTPINAGDTLYITVVSIDDNGQYKNVVPGSYRVIAIGSQTGASCEDGGITLGPTGLRSHRKKRRSKEKTRELEARKREAKLKKERHKPKIHNDGNQGGMGGGGGLGKMIMKQEEARNPEK